MAWDRTAVVVLTVSSLLAACEGGGFGDAMTPTFGGRTSGLAQAAPPGARLTLASKNFTVAGPRGFCVDKTATRETETEAFVLLAACQTLSGEDSDDEGAPKPAHPAILTASLAPGAGTVDEATLDRLAGYFTTDAGHAALARHDGGKTELLDLNREPGLVLVHARDGVAAGSRSVGLAGDYWRAVFAAAGTLVTVTVSGFASAPMDAATGQALTRDFVAALSAANTRDRAGPLGAGRPPAPPAPAAARPDETRENPLDGITTGIGNFLDRLL